MICIKKKGLEHLLEKKPELEERIIRALQGIPDEFGSLAYTCYVCDGNNYNCEYHKMEGNHHWSNQA
jgi:hypothetical protein